MPRSPRNELAAARERAGLSQEALAEMVGVSRDTIARWERGDAGIYPHNRLKWVKALGVSVEELEGMRRQIAAADDVTTASQRTVSAPQSWPEAELIDLQEPSPHQPQCFDDGLWKLQGALHPPVVSPDLLGPMESHIVDMDQAFGHWSLDRLWQETGQLLEAVSGWLSNPQPVATRRRLTALAGRLAGLRGCVLVDQMQHREAMQWLRTAESAAREALDVDLAAWVLAYQSLVSYDNEDFTTNRQVLEEASALAHDGGTTTVRAWVGVLLARSQACVGDRSAFHSTADQAARLLDATDRAERRHGMDFAGDQLDISYYTGLSMLSLEQFDKARSAFVEALGNLPAERRRARAMLRLSVASVASRERKVDEAMSHLGEALILLEGDPAGRVAQRAFEVRASLNDQSSSPAIRELDERMALVAGPDPHHRQ